MEYFWIFTKPSTFVLAGRSPCEDKKTSIPGALKALISLPTSPTSPLSKILMSFLSDGRSFIGSSSAPGCQKRIFPDQTRTFSRTVPPINFSASAAVWRNNVADEFIDNHIFSECQEKSSDLKVAPSFGNLFDFPSKTYKFPFCEKNRVPFSFLGFIKIS